MEKKYLDEWKRAKDFLESARNNLNLNDIKTTANREYFAVERAVVCLLLIENKKVPKNHKIIWEMSKLLSIETNVHELMRKLYDLRLQADYGKVSDIAVLNKETVNDYLNQIEVVMKTIERKYNLK